MEVIPDVKFHTDEFFSGGAGMFLQYHDVVKPVYLYAMVRMVMTQESFGLPIDLITRFSNVSLVEWYLHRRYRNPLQCLDWNHQLEPAELDDMLYKIITSDPSLYSLAPALNIGKMFDVYLQQRMTFPVYLYTERKEPMVLEDAHKIFPGIPCKYVYGDLRSAVSKCDQNFTYIFSDIEQMKIAVETLSGTCSHVLLCRDYRYNFIGNYERPKYDLRQLEKKNTYIRTGTTLALNPVEIVKALKDIYG